MEVIWRLAATHRHRRASTILNLQIRARWAETRRRCTAPLQKRPIAGKSMGDPLTLYFKNDKEEKKKKRYMHRPEKEKKNQCCHVPIFNVQ